MYPYCKSHIELSPMDYENKIYCNNCWFKYDKELSQLYGDKCYITYKNIDNIMDLGIIKKILFTIWY